ncbi:MAG: putative DNA-binding domain-containing protein [Alphaproteobacteria bacterium]|nr:putative DNA-binding domain-containing protein [Alphaproteobacteria bacterium]
MTSNAGSLADLQRSFQDYVLASGDAFHAAVRDTKKADRATLLQVYRDGYALRLIEVLTNDYPGVLAMAGPADFDRMARAYIAAHPSRHPSVRPFGKSLAPFLAATAPYSDSPAAIEMARFEWAMGEAFDAPNAEPLSAATVMALPPEAWATLAFTAVPSLRYLTLAYEVPQAWQRREEVEAGNLEAETASEATGWAIWRPELETNYRSLEPDEAVLLDALIDGRPFPDLCAAIAGLTGEDQAPARAAGLLRAWFEAGMIADCRF